jgi:uncharacterized protein
MKIEKPWTDSGATRSGMPDIILTVREIARKALDGSRGSHDWEHTERVYALALRIAREEGADELIVALAALLHDIARSKEDESGGKISHAEAGAEAAREILSGCGEPDRIVEQVALCIESHRWRGTKTPQTKEAMVLFDADKLDSIGAVGIGRTFLFAGEVGARLHNKGVDLAKTEAYTQEDTAYREYMLKLRFIREKMLTKTGRSLAEERHEYMAGFFDRLDKEVDGIL